MIDAALLRQHFPSRPAGYFDTAAVGCAPVEVADAVRGVAEALGRGLTGSSMWHRLTDGVEELVAPDLGCAPEAIEVLASTSEAIGLAATAMRLSSRDDVVVFADDFPSARMPWHAIGGPRVVEVPGGAGPNRTQHILAALGPKTRVVSITHVHASTGAVADLAAIHAACLSIDAMLVVDGAQAGGLLPDAAIHSDVYAVPSYKWLHAGFGAAVVMTGPRFRARAVPSLVGHRNPPPSPSLAPGHDNLFGLAALRAAARVREGLGREAIRRHVVATVGRVVAAASDLGVAVAPAGAGIVSLEVVDAAALQARLRADGIHVAVRDGLLRISPSVTSTEADLDGLLGGIARHASTAAAPHQRNRPTRTTGSP